MTKITIIILALQLALVANADHRPPVYNFLTDGTEIKIVDGKVYAMCSGKFSVATNGEYELADGSHIYVYKGKLRNKSKAKKWMEYVSPDQLDQKGDLIVKEEKTLDSRK